MHYSDLVTLYFQQSEMLQTYWTVYVVVIGGLIAVAAMRREPDYAAGVLATILFFAFSYKNMGAIQDTINTRLEVLHSIQDLGSNSGALAEGGPAALTFHQRVLPTLEMPALGTSRKFHLACDAITIITLWSLQLRRRRMVRESMAHRA